MNADKQDKHQQQRRAQSLYRKKKHKTRRRSSDNKIWTVSIIIAFVFALFFLMTSELYFMDRGFNVPEFFRKIVEDLNN